MKLYLSGWESDLVERALREVQCESLEEREKRDNLLNRIDNCKKLQNHR